MFRRKWALYIIIALGSYIIRQHCAETDVEDKGQAWLIKLADTQIVTSTTHHG